MAALIVLPSPLAVPDFVPPTAEEPLFLCIVGNGTIELEAKDSPIAAGPLINVLDPAKEKRVVMTASRIISRRTSHPIPHFFFFVIIEKSLDMI
jgi:hypothetical protein